VCVDGFIPPRAFQEFQASGILPIAADIRTREHLVYTPAPDIVHEAAGHAPILPDPVFAAYLRRIGELGKRAFTVPEEDRVFRAIHTLSEVKENPAASREEVASAEAELEVSLADAREPSEAARLSRLYWWTAEYGLVGRVDDYKIYGAGLLSSLWESYSCHDSSVRKLPLDERCVEVAYDITRPQPQLFVVPDFDSLHDVVERVGRTLAVEIGGEVALARALRSSEVGSVEFTSGAWVVGVLRDVGPRASEPAWLDFEGPVAFAWEGRIAPEQAHLARLGQQWIPTGYLEGGSSLVLASDDTLRHALDATTGRHVFRFASGARVEGRLQRVVRNSDGRLMHLELTDARLTPPGRAPRALALYALLAAGDVVTAQAGAIDARYYADTPFSSQRVPKARTLPAHEHTLLALYERAQRAHRAGPSDIARVFPAIHSALQHDFPQEWLLRWNLLESLLKIGDGSALAQTLRAELEMLEVSLHYREPIASGLRYLSQLAA
jgi:phenylalanine-4-hydroxylase